MGPSSNALETAMMQATSAAEAIAKAVSLLDADLQEGKALFGQVMSAVFLSLADHDRLERERTERYIKRAAIFNAVASYL